MYHHRYQPQFSALANRNSSAFASNNNSLIDNKVASSQYHNLAQNHSKPLPSVDLSAPAAAASASSTSPTASIADSGASGGIFNCGTHYRIKNADNYHASPFSSLPKQFVEERQDVIFRRVRGILNKITPETFDKLTKELVNVGLDSPRTLRGVIYLLFDKALKDLKYSSLYAKLCQELSEKSPNFERDPGPNTFCKFLISKCEDEFERRRKATEDFDSKNDLTDEEFEQRTIAKQKMLGNIKFICELGKKRLLQEEILHECIRGLLSKKKKEKPIQDQAQDLECLCQIMRTIGSLLDVEASRNLMNQYFERIDMFSKKPELPSRIRFMLRDVIDLRNNNWRPRPFQREDNVPQPLSKLREELGFGATNQNVSLDKLGNKSVKYINDLSKLTGNKLNSLLLDDEPSFTTTTDFHWGSPLISDGHHFDIFSNTIPDNRSASANPTQGNIFPNKTSTIKQNNNFMDATRLTNPGVQFGIDSFGSYKITSVNDRVDPFQVLTRSKPKNLLNNNNEGHDRRPVREGHNTTHVFEMRNGHINKGTQNIRGAIRDHVTDSSQVLCPGLTRSSEDRYLPNSRFNRALDYTLPYRVMNQQRDINDANLAPSRDELDRAHLSRSKLDDGIRSTMSQRHLEHVSHDLAPIMFIHDRIDIPNITHKNRNQAKTQVVDNLNKVDISKQYQSPNQITQDKVNHKDRRLGRNANIEVRPVKFASANYRPPGRDRERIPDSELSQDWRADASKPQAPLTSLVESMPRQSKEQPAELKKEIESLNISQPIAKEVHESKPKSSRIAKAPEMKPLSTIIDTILDSKHSIEEFKPDLPDPRNERLSFRKTGDDNLRVQDKNTPTVNNPGNRRSTEVRQAALHPPSFQTRRNNNQDFKDRRDAPKRQNGPPIEFDGRVFQRPYQNDSSSLERRKFKPSIPRNQSFDAPHGDDSKKKPSWRREGSHSNQSILSKETTAVSITNSMIPKAPSRSTDTEFSLRPSHSLAGRTIAPMTIQAPKTSPPTADPAAEPVELNVNAEPEKKVEAIDPLRIQESHEKHIKHVESDSKTCDLVFNKSISITAQFISILSDILNNGSQDLVKIAPQIKELEITKQDQVECLVGALKKSISGSLKDRSTISRLLALLVPSLFETGALTSAFEVIFDQMQGMEVETPKVKSLVAGCLSSATSDGLLSISDVAEILSGGKHHPLFLLYLQNLDKSNGKAWLVEKINASKIKLIDQLPEVDRSKDRLAIALKDRCLGFLDPMLTIEPDLWEQMTSRDASAASIYRWIRENVDPTIQSTTTFAHVFVRCLLRYIHETSSEKLASMNFDNSSNDSSSNGGDSQSSKSSPVNAVVQALSELEKESLSKYQHILQAILKEKRMQLASLYALQTFYYGLDFPKGALLRWFHLLYDMSIVDDDVYFVWREEINDEYPGKGQALFQVNTWLHWLAEAESEEDEEE